MPQPLNAPLFAILRQHFGSVRVTNEGQRRVVQRAPSTTATYRTNVLEHGEQYAVNCPFCGDQRQRLHVSHAYGWRDPVFHRPNYSLWCCFNENCHQESENRDRFRLMTAIPIGRDARPRTTTPATTPTHFQPPVLALPASVTPITHLPPDHRAVRYLSARGFDPQQISAERDLSYSSIFSSVAAHRLVIPVYMPTNSSAHSSLHATQAPVLAGWQARLIEPADQFTPKYIFPGGMHKSELLYGLPLALQTSGPVVVCEGPTDCWRVGPAAVGLFGKTASTRQLELLVLSFPNRPIVVLLDSDAQDDAQRLVAQLGRLRQMQPGDRRVVLGHLPQGRKDPAECMPEEIVSLIGLALDL